MLQFGDFDFHNDHFAELEPEKSLQEVKNTHYDEIECDDEDYLYTDAIRC